MVCWALWTVRNDQVWNNKGAIVEGVVSMAYTVLEQWTNAQDKTKVSAAGCSILNRGG